MILKCTFSIATVHYLINLFIQQVRLAWMDSFVITAKKIKWHFCDVFTTEALKTLRWNLYALQHTAIEQA